jgi:hypothetical protein
MVLKTEKNGLETNGSWSEKLKAAPPCLPFGLHSCFQVI